jgi:endonuclease/exonuclease/phosphatase family metal-dependent hydrolase
MRRISTVLLVALAAAACAEQGPIAPSAHPDPTVGPPPHAAVPGRASVMTRNLYLGGDIGLILGAPDPVAAAALVWDQIQGSDFPSRSARLADEIVRLQPDLVGLQEVVTFTIGDLAPPPAFPETALVDFLDLLLLQLEARGVHYEVATRQPNTRAAFPVPVGGEIRLVGYEDSSAILVRSGIPTRNAASFRYQASPPPAFTAGIPLLRGWNEVEARAGGGWVRFVNTHLEIQSFTAVQEAQAAELVARLDGAPLPVILVGDFNSAANPSAPPDRRTGSYGILLGAGFHDVWEREEDPDGGLTCCHAPDLSNATAEGFDQRLDLVLVRSLSGGSGFAGGSFARVVGADAGDRFAGSAGQPLWPSDHAGVAATLLLPPGLIVQD